MWLHVGTVASGTLRVGDVIAADVDHIRRMLILPNHTFTHVLNYALREVAAPLGPAAVGQPCMRAEFSQMAG